MTTDTGQAPNVAPRGSQGPLQGDEDRAWIGNKLHQLATHATQTPSGKKRWLVTCTCSWVGPGDAKNIPAAIRRGQLHINQLIAKQPKRCPHPRKARFTSKRAAGSTLTRMLSQARFYGEGPMPSHAYKCRCGYWHLTSKAQSWAQR